MYSDSPPVVIERAVSMLTSQFSEGGVLAHPLHWQALRVRHEQPPHLKFTTNNIASHFDTSEENPRM